jgi:hypothetical protein
VSATSTPSHLQFFLTSLYFSLCFSYLTSSLARAGGPSGDRTLATGQPRCLLDVAHELPVHKQRCPARGRGVRRGIRGRCTALGPWNSSWNPRCTTSSSLARLWRTTLAVLAMIPRAALGLRTYGFMVWSTHCGATEVVA